MSNNDSPLVKIFVSHRIDQDSVTIDDPVFVNVRCGAVFDKRENNEMLGDDTGDNISEKRDSYAELTVVYWAWKNISADYYGLFHYRRYFSFSDEQAECPLDYITCDSIYDYKKFCLNGDTIRNEVKKYDVIVSHTFSFKKETVGSFFKDFFGAIVFEKIMESIKEQYIDYYEDANLYFNGKTFIHCNMFIMEKNVFREYCEWLFPLLKVIEEKIKDCYLSSPSTIRHTAWAGEWLLGVFVNHLSRIKTCKIGYKELVVFDNTKKYNYDFRAFNITNDIPIILSTDRNSVLQTSVVLNSLIRKSSFEHFYDVYILHGDIDNSSMELISSFCKEQNCRITFVDMDSYLHKNNRFRSEINCSFYSLLIPAIFKNYEKMIFIDNNSVINKDVAELYNIDVKNNWIGGVIDYLSLLHCTNDMLGKNQPNGILDIVDNGVLILNNSEIRKSLKDFELWDYSASNDVSDHDAINAICKNKILFIDYRWNVFCDNGVEEMNWRIPFSITKSYNESVKDPFIYNFGGRYKPWRNPTMAKGDIFWDSIRGTRLYEMIMFEAINGVAEKDKSSEKELGDSKNTLRSRISSIIWGVRDLLFPWGSKRRYTLLNLDQTIKKKIKE